MGGGGQVAGKEGRLRHEQTSHTTASTSSSAQHTPVLFEKATHAHASCKQPLVRPSNPLFTPTLHSTPSPPKHLPPPHTHTACTHYYYYYYSPATALLQQLLHHYSPSADCVAHLQQLLEALVHGGTRALAGLKVTRVTNHVGVGVVDAHLLCREGGRWSRRAAGKGAMMGGIGLGRGGGRVLVCERKVQPAETLEAVLPCD